MAGLVYCRFAHVVAAHRAAWHRIRIDVAAIRDVHGGCCTGRDLGRKRASPEVTAGQVGVEVEVQVDVSPNTERRFEVVHVSAGSNSPRIVDRPAGVHQCERDAVRVVGFVQLPNLAVDHGLRNATRVVCATEDVEIGLHIDGRWN